MAVKRILGNISSTRYFKILAVAIGILVILSCAFSKTKGVISVQENFFNDPYSFTLEQKYDQKCKEPSDIHEHLPTLRSYASKCRSVVECGVRSVVSSYAFATGLQKTPGASITLVDLEKSPNVEEFLKLCQKEGLQANFIQGSDLETPLQETDLLFLDTWHVYGHLKRELARWHPYAKKYIILHDTTVDGVDGETVRLNMDAEAQSRDTGVPVHEIKKGLWPAVEEFLQAHPEWSLKERFTNNNGLTVLERKY